MKTLENCRWVPRWVSHMGCIQGCLHTLGITVSDAWLYGGTGHAFVMNLHEELCPSGPTAWNTMKLFELGPNLGYKIEGVFGMKSQDDFGTIQRRAWEHTRQAIDQGRPCYGWELEIPEFYVIYGYDDAGADTAGESTGGYHFSGPGCDEGKGPKPWQALGDTGIGVLELYSVSPGEAADDLTTVEQALAFALEMAESPDAYTREPYKAGLAGYNNWIGALKQGKASDMGMRYNTAVWLECRQNAAGFLQEAKVRLAGRADAQFDAAMTHYQAVARALEEVAAIYPWAAKASDESVLPVDDKSAAAIQALHLAKAAEASGLLALEQLIRAL